MKVTLWGTRGSVASPGPETERFGGNTACIEVLADDGTLLVLDAGTGIRRLGSALPKSLKRVDILLTHLHLDHIQGLGFFAPLFEPDIEVHIWGPASTTLNLAGRLTRYLSPPLFPVLLRDLASQPVLHEVPDGQIGIGPFLVSSALVCHPGPTVGYRIEGPGGVVAYLPDHEPALGVKDFPGSGEWTSGFSLARGADLLIHDAQYTAAEYADRIGWGHCSLEDAMKFSRLAGVRQLVPFHHDPTHNDEFLDRMLTDANEGLDGELRVTAGTENATFVL